MLFVMCSDVSEFPQIYLHLQGYYLNMTPQDYFVKHDEVCYLGFQKNPNEFWLLGDNFFRGFYMIHDDENGRIGIVPHSTSNKERVLKAALPDTYLPSPDNYSGYQKIEILVVAVLVFFIIIHWVVPKVREWLD